jgi:signal transduction histidine kinase
MHAAEKLRRHCLVPALVLVLTFTLSFYAWKRARSNEAARELERFDDEVAQAFTTINRATSSYVNALRVVQAFVHTQPELTQESWEIMQRGLEWKTRFAAMLDFGVALFHGPSSLPILSMESRLEHGVHQRGFDFSRDAVNVKAWRSAFRNHAPMATEVQSLAPTAQGIIIFIPIWRRGVPFTSSDELTTARGFVFASINPAEFYNERIESMPGHPLRITLIGLHDPKLPPLGRNSNGTFERVLTVPGVGQGWDLRCQRGADFDNTELHQGSWSLLGGGLLVSLLSSGLAWQQARKQREVESQVKERTAELHHALRHEREMHAMKTRFVHLVSHEFRTPLGIILTSTEMIERYADKLPVEEHATYLRDIEGAARHMNGLIEQVLTLGRAETGVLECKPCSIDLPELCRDWIRQTEALHAATARIEFFASDPMPPAMGDRTLLRLIFINLLNNAEKYSPSTSVIHFKLSQEADEAVFVIHDRGPGIPIAEQAHLFTPFHRAANVAHIPGTGLGLMIVRQCVEAHHGSIRLDSDTNGTVATVRLPLFAKT